MKNYHEQHLEEIQRRFALRTGWRKYSFAFGVALAIVATIASIYLWLHIPWEFSVR